MTFHDFTVRLDGEIKTERVYDTGVIEAVNVGVFGDLLQQHGAYFHEVVPLEDAPEIELTWLSIRSAALAMFAVGGQILSISVLLSGQDEREDTQFLDHFRGILAEDSAAKALPAPRLTEIPQRPLVLSIPLPMRHPEDMAMVGELLIYLAAAFFLQVQRKSQTAAAD